MCNRVPAPKRPIYFNGKFLAAAPTGVHRVARELIVACDEVLSFGSEAEQPRILAPRDAKSLLDLKVISQERIGHLTWQFWEQIDLPAHARKGLLVNLCNLAPLSLSSSITMIHDAQVYSTPQSYGPAFRAWYKLALPAIGHRSSQILTVSEFSKQQLVEFGVAPAEKIAVVHNGGDHILRVAADDLAADALRLGSNPFVLALANVQTHKNIKVLLEAFRAPQLRAAKLVLVGRADRSAFEAAALQPSDAVIFAGAVSDGVLKTLMQRCAALAFPSLTEGFGLPPLEAMMLGRPVVVAPCGALPEVCGAAATYVDPHDANAWATALATLIDDRTLAQDLGRRSREQAARFTWRESASRLLSIVEQHR